ncbi:hypothetical protein ACFVZR_38260 [Streptomyces sp. NPDC058316]|uniref:hypothetical protein n=1 Tax=Streptomyces sp. NPDC058316 TaxID=3346442 RepID=UPI0036E22AFE
MSVRARQDSRPEGQAVTSQERREWTRTERLLPWSVLISEHPVSLDDELSLTATGVFARICSLSPGRTFDAASLAAGKSETPAEMQAALDELAAAGYLAEVAQ